MTMDIKNVLCPVDFSDASTHAIEQATAIAGWFKARITALHVVSPIFMSSPVVPKPGGGSIPESELERLGTETGARFGGATSAGIGLGVFVDVGQPASRILERAASLPADVLVMGTHGTSGFEHLVLGSVTERVLRKASCPVLTVPPHARATSRLPFERVLCAVDFSESSLTALQYAFSLARESGAALTMIHALEWPWEEPPPVMFEDLPPEQAAALIEYRRYCEKGARARLESLIPPPKGASPPLVVQVRNGKSYVQILGVAEEERSDLIVVGVRGRSQLNMTLFGSTTNQVVRRATCPVLTILG